MVDHIRCCSKKKKQDNYMTDRTRCALWLKQDVTDHIGCDSKKTRQSNDMIDYTGCNQWLK